MGHGSPLSLPVRFPVSPIKCVSRCEGQNLDSNLRLQRAHGFTELIETACCVVGYLRTWKVHYQLVLDLLIGDSVPC